MKLSVIIPCYNLGEYVFPMLSSLEKNSNPEIEFVIINDASTDNTAKNISQGISKISNVIYVDNNENIGLSMSRNKAISKITGDYIYLLDGDDKLSKDFSKIIKMLDGDLFYYFNEKITKKTNLRKLISKNLPVSNSAIKREFFKNNIFPKDIIFEDNHFGCLLEGYAWDKGVKKYSQFSLNTYHYTNTREGSITATKYGLKTFLDSFHTLEDLEVEKFIKSKYLFQFWYSLYFYSKKSRNKRIRETERISVLKFLKSNIEFLDSMVFLSLPIIWKIRYIKIKLISKVEKWK